MARMPEVTVPAHAVAQLLAEFGSLRQRAIAQRDDALCRGSRGRVDGLIEHPLVFNTAAARQHQQERHTQLHPLSLTHRGEAARVPNQCNTQGNTGE